MSLHHFREGFVQAPVVEFAELMAPGPLTNR